MDSSILVPTIPEGVEQDRRFTVSVRAVPHGEWQRLETYAARIDMHDVRTCAVGLFDFTGTAEVLVETAVSYICRAVVRPVSLGVETICDGRSVRFTLDRPADLMLEINDERFWCLHLLAGEIEPEPMENVLWLTASRRGANTAGLHALLPKLADMGAGATLAFAPGLYIIGEYMFSIPSGVRLYLAPGAVVVGGLTIDGAEDVRIGGHGVILQRDFHRFSGINGIRVSHSRRVSIEGVTFLDPPHYTVLLGGCEDVTISGIRSFSCEGWSDGVDMMSCRRVTVSRCFLRTSDDCIAVYGSRWDYFGDTRDVLVQSCTLWADVAHPVNIGTHGDHAGGGDTLERLTFRDIDILEHHEHQPEYGGCMAIGAGDGNTVQDVLFERIRIEHIAQGRLLDVRVRHNPDYNPIPGKAVRRISFRDIQCGCEPPLPSLIAGYDGERRVAEVELLNVTVCGRAAEVQAGQYTDQIVCMEEV